MRWGGGGIGLWLGGPVYRPIATIKYIRIVLAPSTVMACHRMYLLLEIPIATIKYIRIVLAPSTVMGCHRMYLLLISTVLFY